MCDCTLLIEKIDEGGAALDRALLEVARGKDPCGFRNLAFHVHRNYCRRCMLTFSWEDLYYETLMRFITSIRKGNRPRQNDCRPLLFQIAKHVCWEWGRKEQDPVSETEEHATPKPTPQTRGTAPNFPIEDLVVLMKMVPELKQATESCLNSLTRKSEMLLGWRYFQDDPVNDPQEISRLLKSEGFNVSPKVIPQEIANSKAKLRLCLMEKLKGHY